MELIEQKTLCSFCNSLMVYGLLSCNFYLFRGFKMDCRVKHALWLDQGPAMTGRGPCIMNVATQ